MATGDWVNAEIPAGPRPDFNPQARHDASWTHEPDSGVNEKRHCGLKEKELINVLHFELSAQKSKFD